MQSLSLLITQWRMIYENRVFCDILFCNYHILMGIMGLFWKTRNEQENAACFYLPCGGSYLPALRRGSFIACSSWAKSRSVARVVEHLWFSFGNMPGFGTYILLFCLAKWPCNRCRTANSLISRRDGCFKLCNPPRTAKLRPMDWVSPGNCRRFFIAFISHGE